MTWTEARGRAIVYARSQGRCELCGRPADSVHHRVKRSQGGTWAPSNLLHVCGDGTRFCHGWAEAHPDHAIALGLWVPSTVDPLTRPVWMRPLLWWRAWWHLHDDGCLNWTDTPSHDPAAAVEAFTRARLESD